MLTERYKKPLAKGSAPSKNASERSSLVARVRVKRSFHKPVALKCHKTEIYRIKRSIRTVFQSLTTITEKWFQGNGRDEGEG